MLSQKQAGTTLLNPRTNPVVRNFKAELWVWIEKWGVFVEQYFRSRQTSLGVYAFRSDQKPEERVQSKI